MVEVKEDYNGKYEQKIDNACENRTKKLKNGINKNLLLNLFNKKISHHLTFPEGAHKEPKS